MKSGDLKKYVVLDVETNGLSSINDDLLSVSIYKPDDEKEYNRFLPLELDNDVYTTYINGITKKMLKKAKPYTQEEINELIEEFELDKRTILTYGNIDEKFIKNYLKRKKLTGYEKMKFYNFKRDIISSRFSEGNITKDNLCLLYGIDNVTEVHTGINDCKLEWQLFEKMNGNKLLITSNDVFELKEDYIIPASYLTTYPNFKYCFNEFPKIEISQRVVKKFEIVNRKIKKFETNITGMTIEHLINVLLEAEEIDSYNFLLENKRKLNYIGRLPSIYDNLFVRFNEDGTISAVNEKDKKIVAEINKTTEELKKMINPVIEYIKKSIFKNKKILSQELVISEENKVLALCDLSNEESILEIKTFNRDIEKIKYQLYYQSKGRNCYILNIDWIRNEGKLTFIISKVQIVPKESKKKKEQKDKKEEIERGDLDIVEYTNNNKLVKFKCNICKKTWLTTYMQALVTIKCPFCDNKK